MGNFFAANSDRQIANGVPRGRGRAPGALSHMVAANLRARALAPVVREIWAAGFMSYNAVSRELNRRNVPPLRAGKQWYPMTAGRLLVRLERAGLIRIRRPPCRGSRLNRIPENGRNSSSERQPSALPASGGIEIAQATFRREEGPAGDRAF
jgi:hypothetical protein